MVVVVQSLLPIAGRHTAHLDCAELKAMHCLLFAEFVAANVVKKSPIKCSLCSLPGLLCHEIPPDQDPVSIIKHYRVLTNFV